MASNNQTVPLSAHELRLLLDTRPEGSYSLVDVRQTSEFMQERLPGAIHIPVGDLVEEIQALPPDKDYIFYCSVGARSSAAALLVRDMQHITGTIYTLTGGLNTWNGFSVAEAPRVAQFDECERPEKLLMKAIDMEKAAHMLYCTIREKAPKDRLCELMDSLVEVEEAHAKVLYKRLTAHWGETAQPVAPLPTFEDLFASMSGKVLEGGMTLEELQPWITSAIHGDCLEVADLALEMEMNAYDLYRTLAHRAEQSAGLRNEESAKAMEIFVDLAEQEKKHARLIMRHMDIFE